MGNKTSTSAASSNVIPKTTKTSEWLRVQKDRLVAASSPSSDEDEEATQRSQTSRAKNNKLSEKRPSVPRTTSVRSDPRTIRAHSQTAQSPKAMMAIIRSTSNQSQGLSSSKTGSKHNLVGPPPASGRVKRESLSVVLPGSLSISELPNPHTAAMLLNEQQLLARSCSQVVDSTKTKRTVSIKSQNNKSVSSTDLLSSHGSVRMQPPVWSPSSSSSLVSQNGKQTKKHFSAFNERLSPAQIHMVRQMWKQVLVSKGPSVLGCELMQRAFFKQPAMRLAMERVPRGAHFNSNDQLLKWHYRTVADVFDTVINTLDNPSEMDRCLHSIGASHALYHCYGVQASLWDTLAEAFIDLTMEWGDKARRTDDSRKAWALLVSCMSERFKQGHKDARRGQFVQQLQPELCPLIITHSPSTNTLEPSNNHMHDDIPKFI